jgi:hypothetical protein
MFVKEDIDILDLDDKLWSGAERKWRSASNDQKQAVWASLNEVFGDKVPTMTEVNDFIWFDCDDIFDKVEEAKQPRKLCRKGRCETKKPAKQARTFRKMNTPDHI